MFVDLALSTHWCAQVGTKRLGVWCVVDMSNRARNRTEDVGGGGRLPKGADGAPKRYFLL